MPFFFLFSHQSESESRSVVSNSLRPHSLCSPWNSPGQNTGLGSLSLLQGILCPFFVTPWTVALQDPLSVGFSRQDRKKITQSKSPTKQYNKLNSLIRMLCFKFLLLKKIFALPLSNPQVCFSMSVSLSSFLNIRI